MGIQYKRYHSRLRLLRSLNVEENPGQRVSRRSCRVLYANIRVLHKYLSNLSLSATGGYVFFFSLRLLSFPGATFLSLWFQVLVDRCSYSGVRLIGFESWLYT